MYSLWMVPPAPLYDLLRAKIKSIATKGDILDAPLFTPHVTLVGGFSAISDEEAMMKSKAVVSELKPFDIELERVSVGDTFHQCVFILCRTSCDLMRAGAYARALFGQDPDAYVPHLSLLYSDAISRNQKEQLAETEQQDLFIGWDAGSVQTMDSICNSGNEEKDTTESIGILDKGKGKITHLGRNFVVDSLHLYWTPPEDKTLESWKKLAVFPITG